MRFFMIWSLVLQVLFSFSAKAQINEWYYSDTLFKPGGGIEQRIEMPDGIIFSGHRPVDIVNQPTVTRIDTNGIIRWQYAVDHQGYVEFMDRGADSTILVASALPGWMNNPFMLSRISMSTGQPVFEAQTVVMARVFDICAYDSISFLLACRPQSSTTNEIHRYNSLTGQFMMSMQVTLVNTDITDMEVDPVTKDIFLCGGSQAARFAYTGFSPYTWANDFSNVYNVEETQKFDFNLQTGQLYLFGGYSVSNRALIVRLNPLSGTVIWSKHSTVTSDVRYADHVRFGKYIVATWEHLYIGSGHSAWQAFKVDSSGTIIWDVQHDSQPFWNTSCQTTGHYSALAIDADVAGDIYLTGYYCNDDWGPENWGIMKLKGTNGSKLFDKTITLDSSQSNDASWGKAINIIGSRLYCLGNIQTSPLVNAPPYQKATHYFVKMDLSGAILDRKFMDGAGSAPSETKRIVKYGTDKTVVLKQVDRAIEVELYSYNEQLIWSRHIVTDEPLFAHTLSISNSGIICVNAYAGVYATSYSDCFLDSIYTFRFDSSGVTYPAFRAKAFDLYSQFTFIGFVNDDNATYTLYSSYPAGTAVYLQKYDAVNSSTPVLTTILYTLNSRNLGNNIMVNNSATDIKVFLQSGILATINKTNLGVTYLSTNTWEVVKEVIPVDSMDFILTGYTGNASWLHRGNVSRFSTQSNSILWFVQGSLISEGACSVIDHANGIVYSAIENKNNNDSSFVLKKINLQSGALMATSNSYTHAPLMRIAVNALAYNSCENELLVAADQHEDAGYGVFYQPVYCRYDSALNFVSDLIHYGDFAGENSARCVQVLADGAVWGGGRLMTNANGKSGYIFELDSAQAAASVITGGPLQFCPGDSVLLTASGTGPFFWNTGDTAQSIYAHLPGVYQVQESGGGCSSLYSNPVYVSWFNASTPAITFTYPDLISTAANAYQWILNGVPISGATSQIYTPAVNGSYEVVVTYSNGCSDTSAPFVLNSLGLETLINLGQQLKLIPNPAHDFVLLQMEHVQEETLSLRVVQTTGQVKINSIIRAQELYTGKRISLAEFTPGIYFVYLSGDYTCTVARFQVF